MKLEVIRFNKGKDSTNGILFDISNRERKFLCYTLEDESRTKKVPGETCIPEGEYRLGFRTEGGFDAKYADRFTDIHMGMLEVLDVPNFKYILIHCGNTDEDTAGCLLVGDSQENNNIKENGFIGKSTHAYYRIYQEIAEAVEKQEEVTITYRDFAKCLILSQTEVSEFFDQC
tara:strand:+ start:285 stop:803 length:519 start_codon:yes stop_codon:yes gene_type:complete